MGGPRVILALVGVLTATGQGWAAGARSPATVLSAVPSAAGGSVWARLKACGLKVRRSGTWVAEAYQANGPAGLQKGDLTVSVWVDMPRPIGTDIGLVWIVRGGRAIPQTGWADDLQNKKEISALRC